MYRDPLTGPIPP